jgi:hypothetical protein
MAGASKATSKPPINQPSDSFSLINDPRNEYSRLYTVDKLGNIWGGRPVLCKLSEWKVGSRSTLVSTPLNVDVNTDVKNLKTTIVKVCTVSASVWVFSSKSIHIDD